MTPTIVWYFIQNTKEKNCRICPKTGKETADLVTFTEILNGKLHFFVECVTWIYIYIYIYMSFLSDCSKFMWLNLLEFSMKFWDVSQSCSKKRKNPIARAVLPRSHFIIEFEHAFKIGKWFENSRKTIFIQVFQVCLSTKEEIYFSLLILKEHCSKKVYIFGIVSTVNMVVPCFIILIIWRIAKLEQVH